jgi:hypothetical protein
MSILYAYLDTAGYVRQWAPGPNPPAVMGLTLHALLPGERMSEYLRMVDGALVSYPPEVLLADVQAGAIADANAKRDRRLAGFDRFSYGGVLYDGDLRAEAAIKLAARSAALGLLPDGAAWRVFDNTDLLLTAPQVIELEVAMIEAKARFVAHHHARCRELKAAIVAATSAADVRMVVAAASQLPDLTEGTV